LTASARGAAGGEGGAVIPVPPGVQMLVATRPVDEEALRRIAELYKIEAQIRGPSAAERREVRQTESKPLAVDLKAWLETQLARASAKSAVGIAIRYDLNHWEGLERFLEDGWIEIDTNVVERSMRPIALNRKNALFAGHDAGAESWACLASLIETLQAERR
jgi:hypothetical protein